MEERNPVNPAELTLKGHVVDHDGNTVQVKLPPGCTISKVYVPDSFDKENGLATALPAGTIIQLHGPNGYGLCRPNGEIVVEPKHYFITIPNAGFFPVIQRVNSVDYLSFTVDSVTAACVQAPGRSNLCDNRINAIFPFEQAVGNYLLRGYVRKMTAPSRPGQADQISYSPRVNRIFEGALDQARKQGLSKVNSAQLLLGVIEEGDGIAARVFQVLAVDLDSLRTEVLELSKTA